MNLGLVSTHAAVNVRREMLGMDPWMNDDDDDLPGPVLWCMFYLLAFLVGYAGIFDLETWHLTAVKGLTAGFIVFTCLWVIIGLLYGINSEDMDRKEGDILPGGLLISVWYCSGALYSDWIWRQSLITGQVSQTAITLCCIGLTLLRKDYPFSRYKYYRG